MESGVSGKGDFSQEQYSTLTNYVDASIIGNAINRIFQNEFDIPNHYPTKDRKKNADDPLIYVKQFIWLYQNELSKQDESLDPGLNDN